MLEIRDEKNYIKVVEDYADMLFRIAYQNLENKADAEDVVQDVFVKLLKQKKSVFEDEEHLKAWLIRVAINQCHDYKRILFRKKEVCLDEEFKRFEERKDSLIEEISELAEDERNIIYLYYYEGYTIKEISHILGKKQNTINSKLTRARKKLKNILEEEDHESIHRINA